MLELFVIVVGIIMGLIKLFFVEKVKLFSKFLGVEQINKWMGVVVILIFWSFIVLYYIGVWCFSPVLIIKYIGFSFVGLISLDTIRHYIYKFKKEEEKRGFFSITTDFIGLCLFVALLIILYF